MLATAAGEESERKRTSRTRSVSLTPKENAFDFVPYLLLIRSIKIKSTTDENYLTARTSPIKFASTHAVTPIHPLYSLLLARLPPHSPTVAAAVPPAHSIISLSQPTKATQNPTATLPASTSQPTRQTFLSLLRFVTPPRS